MDQIARSAIRIADADGLAAVSMERVAREVHVTTMALYRYFPNKEQLIEAMIDLAGGPAPQLDGPPGEWRSRLAEWTHRCASIYREHSWFLQAATARRRIMGPNELEWFDAALRVLRDTGLSFPDQWGAFLALIGHVRSNSEFSSANRQGLSRKQWAAATARLIADDSERYPALASAIRSGSIGSMPDNSDFGLQCILEGIASLANKHRR